MSQYRPLFVLCVALLSMLGRSAAFSSSDEQSTKTEVKTPAEWFKRASDQMSLRLPGAAPFHLKVVFHAFPGEELLDSKEAPQMVTGDGTYEETWIAPHQWRREITLGSYRAVEVESD